MNARPLSRRSLSLAYLRAGKRRRPAPGTPRRRQRVLGAKNHGARSLPLFLVVLHLSHHTTITFIPVHHLLTFLSLSLSLSSSCFVDFALARSRALTKRAIIGLFCARAPSGNEVGWKLLALPRVMTKRPERRSAWFYFSFLFLFCPVRFGFSPTSLVICDVSRWFAPSCARYFFHSRELGKLREMRLR